MEDFKLSETNRRGEETGNPCFQGYYESFYKGLHAWRDYEKVSAGYAEWYYDCLPSNREAKILDIGSGDGKFLFFLRQRGYPNIEGLELCAPLADLTVKRLGCTVHVVSDTCEFLARNPVRYDSICMNDVLEHVPKTDTIAFLTAAGKSLMPGGNLVVNVPQAVGFSGLYSRYNDFTHETLFTEMSLRQVMLIAGFRDIRFIEEKWPLKLTPRHLAFRFARWVWFLLIRLIYFIENPGEIHPRSFQARIVVSATR
jgi:2-polyprenyl-3-methyl-5-hydroxy-6-metoxy-1,4-benzoquinol methylase